MRGPEHRIPAQPAEMSAMSVRCDGVMHGKGRAAHGGQHQYRELKSNRRSHSLMCSGFFCPCFLPRVAVILSHAVKSSNHRLPAPPLRAYPNVVLLSLGYSPVTGGPKSKPLLLYRHFEDQTERTQEGGLCTRPARTWLVQMTAGCTGL